MSVPMTVTTSGHDSTLNQDQALIQSLRQEKAILQQQYAAEKELRRRLQQQIGVPVESPRIDLIANNSTFHSNNTSTPLQSHHLNPIHRHSPQQLHQNQEKLFLPVPNSSNGGAHHRHTSSLPTHLTSTTAANSDSSINMDNNTGMGLSTTTGTTVKLNGLALLKAKAKAKLQQQNQQIGTVTDSTSHPQPSNHSLGLSPVPVNHTHVEEKTRHSPSNQSHQQQPNSHSESPSPNKPDLTILSVHDDSPAHQRYTKTNGRDTHHTASSLTKLRPKKRRAKPFKKRQINLDAGPYKSRFDSGGSELEEESFSADIFGGLSFQSTSVSSSQATSPTHSINIPHSHSRSKKKNHLLFLVQQHVQSQSPPPPRSLSEQDMVESRPVNPPHQQQSKPSKERPSKKVKKSRNKKLHSDQSTPTPDDSSSTVAVESLTSPLFHSTSSLLPQLPHHLKRKQQQQTDGFGRSNQSTPTKSTTSLASSNHGIALPTRLTAQALSTGDSHSHHSFSSIARQPLAINSRIPMRSVPNMKPSPFLTALTDQQRSSHLQPTAFKYPKRLTTG